MDMLSVNTHAQAVHTPVTATSPTAKIDAPVTGMDTVQPRTTEKQENVDMQKLTDQLNTMAEKENVDISFGYNQKIDKVVINITDKHTGEVIRKLPSEDAVKFAEGMQDLLGKLLDKKG